MPFLYLFLSLLSSLNFGLSHDGHTHTDSALSDNDWWTYLFKVKPEMNEVKDDWSMLDGWLDWRVLILFFECVHLSVCAFCFYIHFLEMFCCFLWDQLYRKLLPFIYNLTSVRYGSVFFFRKKQKENHTNTVTQWDWFTFLHMFLVLLWMIDQYMLFQRK